MSGQGCDARIALTLRHAIMNEATPIRKRPLRADAAGKEDPPRQRRQRNIFRRAACSPDVWAAAGMDRRRSDDIAAFPSDIDALGKSGPVPNQATRMREIKVAPSAAGCRFDCYRQPPEPSFQTSERDIPAMLGIDIEHNQIRYFTGDDPDVGVRPTAEPISDLFRRWASPLQRLPDDEWPLVAAAERQTGPPSGQITLRCFNRCKV